MSEHVCIFFWGHQSTWRFALFKALLTSKIFKETGRQNNPSTNRRTRGKKSRLAALCQQQAKAGLKKKPRIARGLDIKPLIITANDNLL